MTTLRKLVQVGGPPYASVIVSAPSRYEDAEHRMEIRWKNARRALDDAGFPEPDLEALDKIFRDTGHDAAAALAVIRSAGGPQLVEHLAEEVREDVATVDELPRLGPILASRQRAVPHVVVTVDRAGADIVAFSGGEILAADSVEGERLHIHRGHPGGWSQRRFQQRAENRWEANSKEVADAVEDWAARVGAEVIAVAGDVRAVTFLVENLPIELQDITHVLDTGDVDGITDETLRLVEDAVARRSLDLIGMLRDRRSAGLATVGVESTLEALSIGRVEHLLVHDDPADDRRTSLQIDTGELTGRVVDVAISRALATDAEVRIVPRVADLTDGIGALLRW